MSPPVATTGHSWRRRIVWALLTLVIATYFFVPVATVLDTSLDVSNYASYTRFAAERLQFGTEVVPMAGPFGFVVYGWVYSGDLYFTRLILEFATKIGFAALVLWTFSRTRKTATGWWWLLGNLLVLPTTVELTYDFPVLYAALFLLFERPRWWVSLATVAFLAFLALCKGTQLIFTVAVLAVVCGEAAWRRAWRDLAVISLGFVSALGMLWLLAGQHLVNLPAYIRNIQELSTGYVSGMALQEPALTFGVGVASFAIVVLSLVVTLAPHWRRTPLVAGAAVIGGFTFLQWKHGFVRADGHVFLFFHYCIIGALTVLILDQLAGGVRTFGKARVAICGATIAVALYGSGDRIRDRFEEYGRVVALNVPSTLRQLFSPLKHRQGLEARIEANRLRYGLPGVAWHVGDRPIAFFGYESGHLRLNRLRERPNPVAGGGPFSVFTPRLQRIDEQQILSPDRRPDFFLLKFQTIDDHFIAHDDAPALNALLQTYQPILAERGMLLFKTRSGSERPPVLRELQKTHFTLGDVIPVPAGNPGEMVLAAFDLPVSTAGTWRAALYKAPLVSLEVTSETLPPMQRRIIPSMAGAPFIVTPVLQTTRDVLALYDEGSGHRCKTLRVKADPAYGFAASKCTVTFYAQSRPRPINPSLYKEIEDQFAYVMANRRPASIDSAHARTVNIRERLVQIVEPPGRMVFNLTEDDREVFFDYGLDPDAYTRGTTDGADFIVEYLRPSADPEIIFSSRLEPRTVPNDKGTHHGHAWIPVWQEGAKLQLRTAGGRHGAADWDWTYWDNVRVERGKLRLDQFPGFHTAPDEVKGGAPRMIKHDEQDVLLLGTPGKLVYHLTGKERLLEFSGGLIPGAYTEGQTDGAEYIVDVMLPDGTTNTLCRRWLRPKTEPNDRGTQHFKVPLPSTPPATRLTITISPGPNNDGSWDWTYLGHVKLSESK